MDAKEWLDTVEKHMERKTTPVEQRYVAMLYDPEETDESAKIVSDLILECAAAPSRTKRIRRAV